MSSEAATEPTDEPALRRPRRPKRKLNTPVNLALTAILIAVVAFWLGGKLKGDESAAPAGMPGFAASASGSESGSGFPGLSGDSDSTRGEITSLSGNTLYVETTDGTTIKVKVKSGATVVRTAETKARHLHPGDTVTVAGNANKVGTVKATEVTATQSGVNASMPAMGGMPAGGSMPSGQDG